jgi:hypothetical protein
MWEESQFPGKGKTEVVLVQEQPQMATKMQVVVVVVEPVSRGVMELLLVLVVMAAMERQMPYLGHLFFMLVAAGAVLKVEMVALLGMVAGVQAEGVLPLVLMAWPEQTAGVAAAAVGAHMVMAHNQLVVQAALAS